MKRLPIFSGEEQFFLIEILPAGVNATLVGMDEDKNLVPRRIWEAAEWSELNQRLGSQRFAKNVIVAADSSIAYTATVPIRILRENPQTTLFAVELENLLAKEVGRVFSLCRADASRILGVDDLDVVLANSRVTNLRLDGHRLVDPVGHRAAKVEASLELMLTRRELFESVKGLVRPKQQLYFTEIGRAELLVLEKLEKLPLHILRLRSPSSVLLRMEADVIGHSLTRQEFIFDEGSFLAPILTEWGIAPSVGRAVYDSYIRGDMSNSGTEFFGKLIEPAVMAFLKEFDSKKIKGTVYLEHDLAFPLPLPLKKGRAELRSAPLGELLERFGFGLERSSWGQTDQVLFRKLAPFFAFYQDKSDTTLNRWLKRHLSWLGAPGAP